jgi:hypothetical protein
VSTIRRSLSHKRVKPPMEMSCVRNTPQVTKHNSSVKRRRLCQTFVVSLFLTLEQGMKYGTRNTLASYLQLIPAPRT